MSTLSKVIKTPTASIVNTSRTALDDAELSTLAGAAAEAGAALKGLNGATSALKAGVTRAVLRCLASAPISAVIEPLKATIINAPSCAAQLSTIRTAVLKMAVTYGEGVPAGLIKFTDDEDAKNAPQGAFTEGASLPVWFTPAEAQASGDAAQTRAVYACINFTEDGARIDAGARDALLARISEGAALFALSEKSLGKIRGLYVDQMQAMVSDAIDAAELAKLSDAEKLQKESDTAIVKDAKAQEAAELVTLRAIAEQARRLIGCSANASMAELLADLSNTDSDNETETEAETATAE